MNPDAAFDYQDFVINRHRIWEARQAGAPQPWTDDPILASRKFTNVYRVLDPGSQFVLTDLAHPSEDPQPMDVLFRCFLYRYTNEPETWRYLRGFLDGYPTLEHEPGLLVEALQRYRDEGNRVFSGAYIIMPAPGQVGDKIEMAVHLAYRWIEANGRDFLVATSQRDRFEILRSERGVGGFMAMQILTDWGYTPQCGEDREAEFVIAGPGCVRGARAVAPTWPVAKTLEWCHQQVNSLVWMPRILMPRDRVRRPSLMDVQNTLCEFSKYHRYAGRGAAGHGQPYRPAHPGPQPAPVLPAHW